jgi:hypothetical protein
MTAIAAPASETATELRQKLDGLRAEDQQLAAALIRQEEALGRAVASGKGETERKRIRLAIADLEAQRRGIGSAIPLVEGDLAAAEEEARIESMQQAEAEAIAAKAELRAAQEALDETVSRLSTEMRPIWERFVRSQWAVKSAVFVACRAAGIDSRDADERSRNAAYYEDIPERLQGQEGTLRLQLARSLAACAPEQG